ncbi:MAG: hypothetical protein ACO1O1_16460 [Adhaeribacter sp.]
MLEVLVYLLLQLGLAGELSTEQQIVTDPTQVEATTDSIVQKPATSGTVTTSTDTSIGGSGWDDKN